MHHHTLLFLCGLWGLNSGPQASLASPLSPGLFPWPHLWVFTLLNVTKVTTLPKLTAVLLLTFGAIIWRLLWNLNEAMPSSNFALCDVILPYVHFCCCDQMQHGKTGLFDFQFQVLLQYYSGSWGRNLKRKAKSTVQSGEKLSDESLSSATSLHSHSSGLPT